MLVSTDTVVYLVRAKLRQVQGFVDVLLQDWSLIAEVAEHGERAYPNWKHTRLCRALGRQQEFNQVDVCIYMRARARALKALAAAVEKEAVARLKQATKAGVHGNRPDELLEDLDQEVFEVVR